MHIVAKLQRLGYRRRIKRELRGVDQRLQLPAEILEQIISYLSCEDKETLSSLYCVSRTFRAIVAPVLYRRIDLIIDGSIIPKIGQLHRTLSSFSFISLTVELNVTLFSGLIDKSSGERIIRGTPIDQCRELETIAGKIVAGFPNLERLTINCELYSRHELTLGFLKHLSTRRLKALHVCCWGGTKDVNALQILAAPCMQTITSLRWSVPGDNGLDRAWEGATHLPNLTGISIDYPGTIIRNLYSQPVRRMCFPFFSLDVERLVWHHAGNITHLNIIWVQCEGSSWDQTRFLQDIAPHLKRIQFLGRLSIDKIPLRTCCYSTYKGPLWTWREDDLLRQLEAIESLGLTLQFLSIDVDIQPVSDSGLMLRIKALFPKLWMIIGNCRGLIRRDDSGNWISGDKIRFDSDGWQILEDKFETFLREIQLTTGEGTGLS